MLFPPVAAAAMRMAPLCLGACWEDNDTFTLYDARRPDGQTAPASTLPPHKLKFSPRSRPVGTGHEGHGPCGAAAQHRSDGAQLVFLPPSGLSIAPKSRHRRRAARPAIASCFASRRICTGLLTRCSAGVARSGRLAEGNNALVHPRDWATKL